MVDNSMKLQRLYIDSTMSKGATLTIGKEQSHYLKNVIRLNHGSIFRVFNGVNGEWNAQFSIDEKKRISATVISQVREQPINKFHIEIWFAPIRSARTDLIIEKATELGVSLIQPVHTQRTQSKKVRVERLKKIAIEAAEQTERLDVPLIRGQEKLFDALSNIKEGQRLYFCDESATFFNKSRPEEYQPTLSFLHVLEHADYKPSIILVGPEGGFSHQEQTMLRSQNNIIPVSLGPRILRAETAVVAALSLWQAKHGDWDNVVK